MIWWILLMNIAVFMKWWWIPGPIFLSQSSPVRNLEMFLQSSQKCLQISFSHSNFKLLYILMIFHKLRGCNSKVFTYLELHWAADPLHSYSSWMPPHSLHWLLGPAPCGSVGLHLEDSPYLPSLSVSWKGQASTGTRTRCRICSCEHTCEVTHLWSLKTLPAARRFSCIHTHTWSAARVHLPKYTITTLHTKH